MDPTPPAALPETPPSRDRRFVWAAAGSALLHVTVLIWLLLPPSRELATPPAPEPVSVEIVTPEQLSSLTLNLSLEPSSSVEVSSEEASSSYQPAAAAEAASSEEPVSSAAASSATPSSISAAAEAPSSAQPSSVEPAASQSPSASEPASSVEQPSAEAAAASAASASSTPLPPQPMPGRPVVIPVGPSEAPSASAPVGDAASSQPPSGEASSQATEAPPILGATGTGADDGRGPDQASAEASASSPLDAGAAPPIKGPLHIATKFYASGMLKAPQMAAAREAIRKLPKARRTKQMCNIEAVGQIGASSHYNPDVVIADALAPSTASDLSVTAPGAAFRSGGVWYGVSYTCTVADDLGGIEAFSFRIGDALPVQPSQAAPAPGKPDRG